METAFLPPTDLSKYNPSNPPTAQPPNIPITFLSAMEVRTRVFVEEQHIPSINEFDADDARSCHWVLLSSSEPIGTIRLVPFPQPAHPVPGSTFFFSQEMLDEPPPEWIVDRKTAFHDGVEPYLKFGRLAVVPEYRGKGLAKVLAEAALAWANDNPTFFNPKDGDKKEERVWKGLVCVHAQVQVEGAWRKLGFETDDQMGTWEEEGILHVGMWRRLDIQAGR
ncbi:acyl-CoA N-acyltransferase [Bisporella sp. PMI_857]|nr:acyl-CoA N-acyltransferase [Bisporella sp. PMI_857]KAH8600554.1 acyl-CoA N-acyltransferase [Bisporella sp. PMI_857]